MNDTQNISGNANLLDIKLEKQINEEDPQGIFNGGIQDIVEPSNTDNSSPSVGKKLGERAISVIFVGLASAAIAALLATTIKAAIVALASMGAFAVIGAFIASMPPAVLGFAVGISIVVGYVLILVITALVTAQIVNKIQSK